MSGIGLAVDAVLSWNTAKELHRIEAGCDAKQARTAERYQAELGAVVGVHRPDTAKGEQYAIMVVNGSDVPIYDIRVDSQKADKSCDNPVLELGALPPGEICYPRSPDVQVGLCH